MEKERQERQKGEGTTQSGNHPLWKNLWSLAVPNAAKVFLWRACNNILPAKDNQRRRGIIQEDICIFCFRDTETASHILWKCPSTMDVWSACGRRVQKIHCRAIFFRNSGGPHCSLHNGRTEFFLILVAKKIWARRNLVVHGGDFTHPSRIVREAEELLRNIQALPGDQAGELGRDGRATEQQ